MKEIVELRDKDISRLLFYPFYNYKRTVFAISVNYSTLYILDFENNTISDHCFSDF